MSILTWILFCPKLKLLLSSCQLWNGSVPSSFQKQCFIELTLSKIPILNPMPILSPSHQIFPCTFLCAYTLEKLNFYPTTQKLYHIFWMLYLKASLYCQSMEHPLHVICLRYDNSRSTNLHVSMHSFMGSAMRALYSFQSEFMFTIKIT